MNFKVSVKRLASIVMTLSVFVCANVNAAVSVPALNLDFLSGDNRVTVSVGADTQVTLEGHAVLIFTDNTFTNFIDITDVPFELTLDISSTTQTSTLFGGAWDHTVSGGSLLVGGGSDLDATIDVSNVSLSSVGTSHNLSADLIYNGGSLASGLSTGTIELSFSGPGGAFSSNYSSGNNLDSLDGNVGTVTIIPVPAAFWFLGSAVLGLVATIRKES